MHFFKYLEQLSLTERSARMEMPYVWALADQCGNYQPLVAREPAECAGVTEGLIFFIYLILINSNLNSDMWLVAIILNSEDLQTSLMTSLLKIFPCPGRVAHLVGASCCTPKGCWFDPQSGHIPRWQVWSLVGACTGGNQLMVSLSL